MLGIEGWFLINILGNRDGEVLDDFDSFKVKEVIKSGVLDIILQSEFYFELYGDFYYKVRINYYSFCGDVKEGWDNIDIRGWLGYLMQIKVDFFCCDFIFVVLIVLDLVLFLDLVGCVCFLGIQEWLSFFFKSFYVQLGYVQEYDFFIQYMCFKNIFRVLGGELFVIYLSEIFSDFQDHELRSVVQFNSDSPGIKRLGGGE